MNLALLHCPSFCPFDHWIGFLLNCGVPIDSETLPLQEDTVEATHDHHYPMHVRTHLETSFLLLRLGLGHAILPSYKQRTQASGSTCVPLASSCIDLIIGWVKHVNICSMLMLILENFNSTSIHIFSEPMWSTTCLIGQQLPQSRRMNDTPATTNLQLEVAYTISWRPKKISRERNILKIRTSMFQTSSDEKATTEYIQKTSHLGSGALLNELKLLRHS